MPTKTKDNTQQEDEALEALKRVESISSLGKVDYNKDRPEIPDIVKIVVGQHILPMSDLAYGGQFYPEGTVIKYKAADGGEIRHFSMVNEQSPLAVDDAMKQIINACVAIYNHKGAKLSYQNLKSMDRFVLALKIREATYPNPTSKLSYDVNCSCGKPLKIELATDKMVLSEFNEHQEKHFVADEKAFIVNSPSYGTIKIEPLTLYREQLYKEYVIDQVERGIQVDTLFAELYWLFVNESNQYQKNIISEVYDVYRNLEKSKLAFYVMANERLQTVPVSKVKDICSCGQEVYKDITFPTGIKHFFIDTTSIASEFS